MTIMELICSSHKLNLAISRAFDYSEDDLKYYSCYLKYLEDVIKEKIKRMDDVRNYLKLIRK